MNQEKDLVSLAALQLAQIIDGVALRGSIPITPRSGLTDVLELLVPRLLRERHPEWERESLDGLLYSSATKVASGTVLLRGACILITDQTITPFQLKLSMREDGGFEAIRIRLGERGGGSFGISGPAYTRESAQRFLHAIESRAGAIDLGV